MKTITQAANTFAFQFSGGSKSISDTCITQGGLVRAIGGKKLSLTRCWSQGAPKGSGLYFVLIATKPLEEFVWDNSGQRSPTWIVNGDEAALRIMGGCVKATIIGVDFCNRKHDMSDGGKGITDPSKTKLAPLPKFTDAGIVHPKPPKGKKYDWWKQVVQWRDCEHGEMHNCRVVGLMDIGKQANPGTPQRVDFLLVKDCGLTSEFHFTDPKSYGKVIREHCYKIDTAGKLILDQNGKRVMWPDKKWTGK